MDLRTRMEMSISETTAESEKVVVARTLILSGNLNEPISVKQRDHNSRVLRLTLRKSLGSSLDLSNATVLLIIQRPDGIKTKLEGTVTNATGGEVEFSFTKDSVSTAGVAKCEVVRLGEDGTTLSSPSFDITIEESLYDDFMLGFGEDEFTVVM